MDAQTESVDERLVLELAKNHAAELWRLARCYATAKQTTQRLYANCVSPRSNLRPSTPYSLLAFRAAPLRLATSAASTATATTWSR